MTYTKDSAQVEIDRAIEARRAEKRAAKTAKFVEAEKTATAYEGSYAEYKAKKGAAYAARLANVQAGIDASYRKRTEER